MSVIEFAFETPECLSAMSAAGAFVDRYPTKIVIYTGGDVPPSDIATPPCDGMTLEQYRSELIARGYSAERVDLWLGRYL